MRRTIAWLLSIILAAATGALLSGTVAVLTAPIPDPGGAGSNAAVVWAFYDAVNAIVQAANTAPLDTLLAPDMIEHDPAPGLPLTRSGLTRQLLSLHATAPGLRLVPEEVFAAGDHVMARVRLEGIAPGRFLGITVDADVASWGSLDQFRVVDRRIVEHWGTAGPRTLLEPLQQTQLSRWFTPGQIVGLQRFTCPPGSRLVAQIADESRLIYLEAGTLTISVDPLGAGPVLRAAAADAPSQTPPQVVVPGTSLILSPGDLLALPILARYTIQNDGNGPAAAVVVPAFPPQPPPDRAYAYAGPPALDAFLIASVPLTPFGATELPVDGATVGFGHVTLSPGGAWSLPKADGPLLIAVESGSLAIHAAGMTVWVHPNTNGASSSTKEGVLAAGDGVLVQPDTAIAFRNLGNEPATLLLVTILPDNTQASAQ